MILREIVYQVLDLVKLYSDDASITEEHVIFLANKYRSALIKKTYQGSLMPIPLEYYQTICIPLLLYNALEQRCTNMYLRDTFDTTLPDLMNVGKKMIYPDDDYFTGEMTYVTKDRFKYVGNNKWLKNIIYGTINIDGHFYLKGANCQSYFLRRVRFSAIFEDWIKAGDMSCDVPQCEVMDREFPLEGELTQTLIAAIVKELTGAAYRPEDYQNNANDDLANIHTFIRQNMKSNVQKQIDGSE